MKTMIYLFAMILAIASIGCAQTTPVTVNLGWTAVGDNGAEGRATSYDVRWAEDSLDLITDWPNQSVITVGVPTPQVVGSQELLTTILDLKSETTYYFAIKVGDEIPNWSDISNIAFYLTPDNIPPGAVVTLQILLQ